MKGPQFTRITRLQFHGVIFFIKILSVFEVRHLYLCDVTYSEILPEEGSEGGGRGGGGGGEGGGEGEGGARLEKCTSTVHEAQACRHNGIQLNCALSITTVPYSALTCGGFQGALKRGSKRCQPLGRLLCPFVVEFPVWGRREEWGGGGDGGSLKLTITVICYCMLHVVVR